jgi:Xaa-Pro aminopeptidase
MRFLLHRSGISSKKLLPVHNQITHRISAFREIMIRENLHALYISGTDPHRSEYLCAHWQTRKFVTGFTGSFGEVVITRDHAGLWTDTRYFLQAEKQLMGTGVELHKLRVPQAIPVNEWLYRHLNDGDRVGVDPFSLPVETYRQLTNRLQDKNIKVIFLSGFPDEVWSDRPPQTAEPVFELAETFAGKSRTEKIQNIRDILHQNECDLTIITALDDLAWTYNLRGSDVAYNPVFYGFAIVGENLNMIFTDDKRIPVELKARLSEAGVQLSDYGDIIKILSSLSDKRIYVDAASLNTALWIAISRKNSIKEGISIPAALKAIKNETELAGFRQAMINDGIAMVEFLWWLKNIIGKKPISEFTAGRKVAEFRSCRDGFMGESFPPIVGYADHGAVVHLSVDASNANEIKPEGVLLIDSGGHYLCGTTDITRTIAVGPVSGQQKRDFTLVLKGMIALSTAVFPEGTKGMHLDILARQALYQNGLNYGHGTGHGVGHFLNVHEGPASIRQEFNPEEIRAGMIFTNEPGLYRKDEYGIRTENMMVCVEKKITEFGKFLGFETLTLCPIDLQLIEISMLTPEEISWINKYHSLVRKRISPFLSVEMADFLGILTAEI